MTDWATASDVELGRALAELGAELDFPTDAQVAAAVDRRLDERPSRHAVRRPRRAWTRRLATVAAAVVLALLATALVSPGARRAVADWLGLRGVRVEYGDGGRAPGSLGGALDLGQRVDVEDAARRLSFPVLGVPQLGPPDEVYYRPTPPAGQVTLLYRAREGLPAASTTGAGLLLTAFRAEVEQSVVLKQLHAGVRLEEVTVGGGRGYWFEGEPHTVAFTDGQGRVFDDRSRLAGNTLVWERGDLTLRLESALSKDESIRLAESLRPLS